MASVSLRLPQCIRILLQRASDQLGLLPQIRRQEPVAIPHRSESRLERVLQRLRAPGAARVRILHAGQLEQSLHGRRGHQPCSSRGGDQADGDAAAFSGFLGRERMWFTEVRAPVAPANGQDGELGNYDGGPDGCSYFFGGFDAKPNVAFTVTYNDDGLETCTLTGAGLLLDRLNLWVGNEKLDEVRCRRDAGA